MEFLKSRTDFLNELRSAPVGASVTYHIGNLIADRSIGPNFMSVHSTAHAAWDAMEKGQIHLFQRYLRREDGTRDCVYLAMKRATPHIHVKWTGCYSPDRFLTHKGGNRHREYAHAA